MKRENFEPSAPLAAALARPPENGEPLYALVVPRRELVDDLGVVPDDATFVALRGPVRHAERIVELPNLIALWSNTATSDLFESCARAPGLRAVYAYQFKRLASVPLHGARHLEHLLLSWAPQLVDLSFLADLPALRTVYLEDMKRVDLTTLPDLPHVSGFHLGGGMWGALEVPSLEPLRRLRNLRYLRLANVRSLDGRLEPLSHLRSLSEIHLPNFFELEEVARLAGALPNVDGLSPVFLPKEEQEPAREPYRCVQCGGTKYMMTGKPARMLCPRCDDARFRKRIARWEVARAAGWPH